RTAQDFEECLLTEDQGLACRVYPLTLDAEAKTLVLKLTGAQKPGVPAYIGPPPAEIERLVADTIAAAEAVDAAMDGPDPYSHWFTVSRLLGTLDRWEPYL
ncbi:MAG TPA: hypothetical protein VIL54_17010, partial [Natronosporangium sp.]